MRTLSIDDREYERDEAHLVSDPEFYRLPGMLASVSLPQVLGNPSGEVLGKFKRNGAAHVDFNFAAQKGIGLAQLIPHASAECVDLITKVRMPPCSMTDKNQRMFLSVGRRMESSGSLCALLWYNSSDD